MFRACVAAGLWPLLVPARTTWLLQRLDTHAFLLYKNCLRRAHQAARLRSDTGDVDIGGLLACVWAALREVLEGRAWVQSFGSDGFSVAQANVAERVLKELELDAPLVVPASRPTHAQLQCCFPRRAVVPSLVIWQPFDGPRAVPLLRRRPRPPIGSLC